MSNNQNQGASIEAELLPCPFCGGPVELELTHSSRHEIYGMRDWYGVKCRNTINLGGTCAIEQVPSASKEAAIECWNRRTPAATTGELPPPKYPQMKVLEHCNISVCCGYTAEQVEEIRRAAIEADRARLAQQGQGVRLYEAALLAVERMRGCAATYIEDHAKDCYPGQVGLRPQDVAEMWAKEIHGIDAKVYLDEAIVDLAAPASAQPADQRCKWPLCQSEEVQQQVADQAHQELYSGAASQPAARVAVPDGLLAELDWCIKNGAANPGMRTHAALVAARAMLAASPATLAAPAAPTENLRNLLEMAHHDIGMGRNLKARGHIKAALRELDAPTAQQAQASANNSADEQKGSAK